MFDVTGGESLFYGNRARLPDIGFWPCLDQGISAAMADRAAYTKEMLKEIRAAKPVYPSRITESANSDAHLERITYFSLGSRGAIEIGRSSLLPS